MDRIDKIDGTSVPRSPRFFRKKVVVQGNSESSSSVQGKVVLGEVEQKLKSMRQRRLDRLSTFLENEYTDKEESEIENAIVSMKQKKETNLKIIVEENVIKRKETTFTKEAKLNEKDKLVTPILSRKNSNESKEQGKSLQKPFSTKKFINKFNCTASQSLNSSVEDLVSDNENMPKDASSIVEQHSLQASNINHLDQHKDNMVEQTRNEVENYNPLLSPVGKLRRGVYLYDRECKFLENEKIISSLTFTSHEKLESCSEISNQQTTITVNNEKSGRKVLSEALDQNSEITLDPNPKWEPKDVVIKLTTRHSYENREIMANGDKKSPVLMKTFKRNSLGDILDNVNIKLVSTTKKAPVKKLGGVDKKFNFAINQYSQEPEIPKPITNSGGIAENKKLLRNNFVITPRSPIPSPRERFDAVDKQNIVTNLTTFNATHDKVSHDFKHKLTLLKSPSPLPRKTFDEEKVLKKFQKNLDSLNEILDNDSDVDSEELDDFKRTLEEADILLMAYKTKLNKVEDKLADNSHYLKRLDTVKEQLKKIKGDIFSFKGLRRDSSYTNLKNVLQNCLIEVNMIESNKIEVLGKKNIILKEVENHSEELERRVIKNEIILLEILEAQVDSISTNIFNITRV